MFSLIFQKKLRYNLVVEIWSKTHMRAIMLRVGLYLVFKVVKYCSGNLNAMSNSCELVVQCFSFEQTKLVYLGQPSRRRLT